MFPMMDHHHHHQLHHHSLCDTVPTPVLSLPDYFVPPNLQPLPTSSDTQFTYDNSTGFSTSVEYTPLLPPTAPSEGIDPNNYQHFTVLAPELAADKYPIVTESTELGSIALSSVINRNQLNDTFDWLEDNFKFRQSVSISRSTIYELYRKFCQQNSYSPVCKATFGKIIRKKFSKVKSKRLGARGHSKYHYYNITFKDERNHYSRLQLFNSHTNVHSASGINPSGPNLGSMSPLSTTNHNISTMLDHCMPATLVQSQQSTEIGLEHYHPTSTVGLNLPTIIQRLTTFSNRNNNGNLVISSESPLVGTALQGSGDSFTSESLNLSQLNLNQNDYHDIIQSMLSYMKIPIDRHQPLNDHGGLMNEKHVFINLYKTHCQCLIDSALSGNYGQMRHYIMHFWQQLPTNIVIYVQAMNSLDEFMYALLEGIYLMSNGGSIVAASTDNLQHLNTIAYLMPLWLDKTFHHLENQYQQPKPDLSEDTNSAQEPEVTQSQQWKLQFSPALTTLALPSLTIGQIKVTEAFRWHYRIKFKIELLSMLKKIDFVLFCDLVNQLIELVESITTGTTTNRLKIEDTDQLHSTTIDQLHYRQFVLDQYPLYLPHLDHHRNQQLPNSSFQSSNWLWTILIENFHSFLLRLKSNNHQISSNTIKSPQQSTQQPESIQLIVDEMDQLIRSIEERFRFHYGNYGNHSMIIDLYQNISLNFVRLSSNIVQLMTTQQLIQNNQNAGRTVISGQNSTNSEWFDYLIDDDEEEEEEEEEEDEGDFWNCCPMMMEGQLDDPAEYVPTKSDLVQTQIYNFLLVVENYLIEVCRQQVAAAASTIPFI